MTDRAEFYFVFDVSGAFAPDPFWMLSRMRGDGLGDVRALERECMNALGLPPRANLADDWNSDDVTGVCYASPEECAAVGREMIRREPRLVLAVVGEDCVAIPIDREQPTPTQGQ